MRWKELKEAEKFILPDEINEILYKSPKIILAKTIDDLYKYAHTEEDEKWQDVFYEVPGKGKVLEARVCKSKNGISVNYIEPYMRRRDPESMLIGDDGPTDKVRYRDVFKKDFNELREETFKWLSEQELLVYPFFSGIESINIQSFIIAPANAGFFAFALGLLQGITNIDTLAEFKPKMFMFIAPPFRHTHFNGKQRVVHNRLGDIHEIFSYNLYPGPSAKKGVYSALIYYGELEGWVTAHASVVQVITPYNLKINIMHEGASGGGKSEINEHLHREPDGSIFLGRKITNGEKMYLVLPKSVDLRPLADDMVLCHTSFQKNNGKLTVYDAEDSWFIRVDHIKNYGTDPDIESTSIHPERPLLFLNIDVKPGSTALLWEHIEDEPGKPCPNPRFILPRDIIPGIVNKPVSIDIRSFGVRTPPTTKENPDYGILGMFHILPPALAWLWRLVSPRGYANPSIIETKGMAAEGVGSYWPFATGKRVTQANLLLEQFISTPKVLNVLVPVKHIGAWEVGFMPEWIMREYLTRRGGKFTKEDLEKSKCVLLGYSLKELVIEGQNIKRELLNVIYQNEVGEEAYMIGAKKLSDFFKEELKQFLTPELNKLGKMIIECFFDDGDLDDFEELILTESIFTEE